MFKIDILGNLEGRFFKVREDFFFIYRIFYLLCSISFNSYTFIRLFLFFLYPNRRILINQEFKRKKESNYTIMRDGTKSGRSLRGWMQMRLIIRWHKTSSSEFCQRKLETRRLEPK